MKRILIFIVLLNSLLFSIETNSSTKESIAQKHLKQAMEEEKKFAREQTFYNADNYNFFGAEVSPESVENTPELELDDLDMDSVYD